MEIGSIVRVKGYEDLGIGTIEEISNGEYPIFIQFTDENLHESEKNGWFNLEQII